MCVHNLTKYQNRNEKIVFFEKEPKKGDDARSNLSTHLIRIKNNSNT